ncbi:hypothetical protein R3P38DRAFT_3292334 [Favolaschia claudopus]|uniref:Uncharacterized protein n=1 Tax=Favolaschia claudopus TaxID=2862362 RepID=A0AAV9ZJU8_9AGAR
MTPSTLFSYVASTRVTAAPKKTNKSLTSNAKRKYTEETPGGLMIVREPAQHQSTAVSTSSKHPTKKFKATRNPSVDPVEENAVREMDDEPPPKVKSNIVVGMISDILSPEIFFFFFVSASDLAAELKESKRKYLEKRNHFIGLSLSFRDRIDQWKTLPRTASKVGKDAVSVYKHRSTKVPSQTAIFQKMLSDDANFGQTAIPRNKVARFLDDGFKIQDSQRKLQRLIADTNEHELVSRRKEIAQRTTKLRAGIDAWRKTQTDLMPKVADKIAGQTLACPEIHAEKLYLPSELTLGEHHSLNLTGLAAEEIRWREAQAFDALRAIQNVVKTLSALRGRKIKNDRQQKQNTRAADNITEATKLRDQHMISYEVARQALLALDAEAALYMKPVLQRRQLCDSHYTDGPLWRFPAPQLEDANEIPSSLSEQDIPVGSSTSGTQMQKRKTAPRMKLSTKEASKVAADNCRDGWLWQLGKLTKMSEAEMDEWANEGDRVQWFRAEAEWQILGEDWQRVIA